jgi:predicted P-loop ATPase
MPELAVLPTSILPTTTVRYAEGGSENLAESTNKETSFRQLGLSLSKPLVTREKFAQFKSAGDPEQHRLKRIAGWIIRAPITGGKRKKDSVEHGRLITLDIDNATPAFMEQLLAGDVLPEWTLFAHTTRSHTPENPRVRIVLLAHKPIQPDDYQRVSRILSQKIDPDMSIVDKVSSRVAQLMYRPSCSADMERHFRYYEQLGSEVDWEELIDQWEAKTGADSRDITKLPRFKDESELREVADKVEDPLLKKGPVGYFCRAYLISELVEGKDGEPPILEGVYEVSEWDQNGTPKRLTYLLGHSQNGVVLYNNDTLCYSHHGSDPAADRTLNAFDLVRIHRFGEADDDMNQPPNARKSYKDMVAFAKDQPAYKRQQGLDRYDMAAMLDDVEDDGWVEEETAEDLLGFDHMMADERQKAHDEDNAEIDDLLGVPTGSVVPEISNPYQRLRAEKPPKDWIATELELGANGEIKPTLTNMAIIIGNDSRLWRKIAFNAFSNQVMLLGDIKTRNSRVPTVSVQNHDTGDNWSDINDIVIRAIIEGPAGPGLPGYGTAVTDRNLVGGVKLAARRNSFHPIRDQIARWRKVEWDGVDRVGTFLQRHLGAEQNAYTAMTMRMMLIASIARVETPGCKFDYALILEGLTGIGKSTLIKILYGEEFFGELDADLADRQAVAEQIAGKWALELPELGSLSKSDYNHAKIFMRRQFDDVRLAYDRSVSVLPRQCVVWGTTNEKVYLKDPYGNRSYWVVKCEAENIDFAAVLREREQLWAQAVVEHDRMRAQYPNTDMPLTLTGEALVIAREQQESVRIKEAWEDWVDQLIEWFEQPVHKGYLLAEMGIPNDDLDDMNDEKVQMIAFTQDMAKEALGFRRGALTSLDNMHWSKLKHRLEEMGFISHKCRIAGSPPKNYLISPDAITDDLRRGYTQTVGAEPTRDSEDEDLI